MLIPISRPSLGEAEQRAVAEVLASGMLAAGPRTEALEEAFARRCAVPHAVATSSGTAALQLALLAHEIGPGDEVVTTPFSFVATVNAILLVGAVPVFADVDPATANIDPASIAANISPRTKAILPVHLYGQMCDMDEIGSLARQHGLAVIEDACQAIGASFGGRPAGSFGTGAFSLYATKNVAAGEGGMITTADDEIARRCRLLRNHGMRARYDYAGLGYNLRMTDLHAAIGLVQLERLDELNGRRSANAAWLDDHLEAVTPPVVAPGRVHAWHQYTIQVADRDRLARDLAAAGVGTGVFYPHPLHQIDHVRAVAGEHRLPVAERLARTVLSLPVHPSLTEAERATVADRVDALAGARQ